MTFHDKITKGEVTPKEIHSWVSVADAETIHEFMSEEIARLGGEINSKLNSWIITRLHQIDSDAIKLDEIAGIVETEI